MKDGASPPPEGAPAVAALARRRRRLARLAARAARASACLATVRLSAALAAVLLLAASSRWTGHAALLQGLAAAAVACFVVAVVLHGRRRRAAERLEAVLSVADRERLRLEGQWRDLPRDGTGLAPDAELADDLGLVGRFSLFHAIGRCATPFGERALAAWLCAGAAPPDHAARQEAVRALARRPGLRLRLEAAGERGARSLAASLRMLPLLARPSLHDRLPWLAPAARLLGAATWAQAAAALAWGVPTLFWPCVALQVLAFAATSRALTAEYDPLLPHEETLLAWGEALALLERHPLPGAVGARLRADLDAGAGGASGGAARGASRGAAGALTALARCLASLQLRQGWLHPVVNALAPWDLHHAARLAAWKRRHGRCVETWLEALGSAEALSSLAGHAAGLQAPCWPVLDPDGPPWSGRAVRHPLLPAGRAVGNDVDLVPAGTLLLVTGSNMSGKSTLLRTVGLQTVLALAGGAVPAAALSLRPCRLLTSIHVTDALDEGVSLFYAEVRRIKRMLDAVEAAERDRTQPPVLYLVDEVLRGTNTRERLAASRAVIRRLAGGRSVGIVTSHDLSLVALEGRATGVVNGHFRERIEEGRMTFDYLLREGPVPTTNALQILRLEGIEVDPADLAD